MNLLNIVVVGIRNPDRISVGDEVAGSASAHDLAPTCVRTYFGPGFGCGGKLGFDRVGDIVAIDRERFYGVGRSKPSDMPTFDIDARFSLLARISKGWIGQSTRIPFHIVGGGNGGVRKLTDVRYEYSVTTYGQCVGVSTGRNRSHKLLGTQVDHCKSEIDDVSTVQVALICTKGYIINVAVGKLLVTKFAVDANLVDDFIGLGVDDIYASTFTTAPVESASILAQRATSSVASLTNSCGCDFDDIRLGLPIINPLAVAFTRNKSSLSIRTQRKSIGPACNRSWKSGWGEEATFWQDGYAIRIMLGKTVHRWHV